MLRDIDDDDVLACGWPWHGRLMWTRAPGPINEYYVDLDGGGRRDVPPLVFGTSVNTWVFDMGLPDIEDEALAAAGGAWWGRAIMRGGYFWHGEQQERAVVPLWWEDDEPRRPMMIRHFGSASSVRIATDAFDHALTWPLGDIGQGAGQPACAVRGPADTTPFWFLMAAGASGLAVTYVLLGAYANRLLYGLVLRRSSGGTVLPDPPGTSLLSSGSGSPPGYYGLIEVTISRALFGPGGSPAEHISMAVIEDRSVALGNPVHDRQVNGSDVDEVAQETAALLTAWYGPGGVIRTARYSRRQECVRETSYTSPEDWHAIAWRTTKIDLIYQGAVVDSRTLTESISTRYLDPVATIERTVSETGVEDDVATWSEVYALSSAAAPSALPVFRAGQGLVMGVVAYTYNVPGHGNVLREQDVRLMWLVPHSNNTASICRSREPFDYPDGQDFFDVEVYAGPAIGPNGPVGAAQVRTLRRARTVNGPYIRSFFHDARWIRGVGNPVTGAVARAGDYVDVPAGHSVIYIGWV